ncbi:putative Sieve element occlusion e [Hibiscus syriacus]|uniref:Sieve element occlusion e n=1 Tax=Hibiscus syriacus TaxID=106335 RepID=A0A6A3BHT3_HIBSY|nr:putative Sieve element occlusion e [Hibiscus syriacus]
MVSGSATTRKENVVFRIRVAASSGVYALKPTLWCDNTSVVTVSPNKIMHSKFKHVELDLFFVGEKLASGELHYMLILPLSLYFIDEILIKKLLLSHDPDRRRLDSEMLLSAVENIMFYATTSEEPVSDEPDKANLKSNIGNIELIDSPEPLMHTIYKIAHEMLCKCPGKGDLHTRTMAMFDLLGSHRWDAKVALAIAAFATSYEAKLHQKLLNLFKKSHIDNKEVLRMLFALKDDLPLKDGSTQERRKVEGSYAIIWVPIHLPKYGPMLRRNGSTFYQTRCHFTRFDNLGTITSSNALDMVFIWGPRAYPFSLSRENELWDGEKWTMQLITNEIHPILTQWVEEGRTICLYGSENLDWIREFNAKMKDIKDAGMQLDMIYVGKNNPDEHTKEILSFINGEIQSNLLSFTKIELFWLRLECMRRSKSRLGNNSSTEPTDLVLAEVLALLHNSDDKGWAVFGKGSSTEVVNVRGDEIIRCSNLFRQWGENVARLEFIDALRTVLELPLVEGPCDHTKLFLILKG